MTATRLAGCERLIAAPVDIVWSMVSTADGLDTWMSVDAEVDLRVGGRISWTHDNGWVVAGEILEVVPFSRLRFTFGWVAGGYPVPVGSSIVTMELRPMGEHTRLRVRHTGLTEEMARVHDHGWAMFLARLADAVTGVGR